MTHPFRFGIVSSGIVPDGATWTTLAQKAESLGYSSLLMPDGPMMGGLSIFAALTAAASATKTLRVGSYVFNVIYRHPVILAREAASVDILSSGRLELGIGAGVRPQDAAQLGIPFGSPGERVGRTEEALRLIKMLFTQDTVDFDGTYYKVQGVPGRPKPVQQPHPPFFIGSGGKRMLTFAGQEAQIIAPTLDWNPQGTAADPHTLEEKIGWVRDAAGDKFDAIELSQARYDFAISDSPTPLPLQRGGPPIGRREMTTEQAVDDLIALRDRYGFSYIQLFDAQMENFAPVVARLAGK